MLVRRMFAGSNSGLGFYSFFAEIIGEDARRLFLLKGGPGTGKSRFMREVAWALGGEQEHFFCSSDRESLDAVAFPRLKIALMDASAPHGRQMELPGCRDELVYLGNFWSPAALEKEREEIEAKNILKREHFAAAFRYLEGARLLEENNAQQCGPAPKPPTNGLRGLIEQSEAKKEKGSIRHLFASAITPAGYVSYIGELAAAFSRKYLLVGPPGRGKSAYLADVVLRASLKGFDAEVFHYPLDPRKILHVFIPGLDLALLTALAWEPLQAAGATVLDFGGVSKGHALVENLFGHAISALQAAQQVHLELEGHYAAHMDFKALDCYRQELISRIAGYKKRS